MKYIFKTKDEIIVVENLGSCTGELLAICSTKEDFHNVLKHLQTIYDTKWFRNFATVDLV